MGSNKGFPAASRGAPERDGPISGCATPGVHCGVMGAIDAHDSGDAGDMPGLIRETGAGVDSPSAPPLPEAPPLTPQTASSSFEPGASSSQLPFLISSSSTASPRAPSSRLFLLHDTYQNPDPSLASHANPLPVFRSFYLSPSVSRSSGAFSLWSDDDPGGNIDDAQSIMPGQTFEAPAEYRFPPHNTSDYFPLADTRIDDTTQLPPCSAGSGRSDRTLGRWARRQHHHHAQHSGEQAPKSKGRDNGSAERKLSSKGSSSKRRGLSRSGSIQKRQAQAGAVPQMTREEFEALPLAIQRKYFSTLERLRFAQESGLVDGISQHYDDISNFKRRNPRQDRSASDQLVGRSRRGSVAEFHSSTSDSSPLWPGPPEATREAALCRENQAVPTIRHCASVILDAADEAVYKLNQQAHRRNLSTTVDVLTPPVSPARHSMDSHDGFRKHLDRSADGHVPQSFYDSFRWLEEEEDLDLRLFLDDYHANLREGTSTTKQGPSFRRHMSISKIPFGRRSSVSSRPVTKDAMTPTSPIHSPAGSVSNGLTHARRKSRALSLITPKHAAQPSITAFDPAAAHYQDPEARLKLRVYLASPQKFDEAVEFGFPSADALSAAPAVSAEGTCFYGQPKQRMADTSSNMHTFLADHDDDEDNLSLFSDQLSLADPDSPKTPEPFEPRAAGPRHARLASAGGLNGRDFGRKTPEGAFYAQAPAASREMTLRMTLTRPDLRAHEDEMYGWQQKPAYQQHTRRSTTLAAESRAAHTGNGLHKVSLEKFPEMDHWNDTTAEKGVMRRIWNRVRRG
ncbi:hypothetical protein C8A01DRAFT_18140 [Parachaetomium inaequale]|uniref:Mucin n=1 Tax=Parachaetomium inaequale TaxID=2588326 RepID=A0AAN6SPP8_9PEZI|nr:hypothetical protein C8A01DRAFT_18140 [Parachaetomium inaequale]